MAPHDESHSGQLAKITVRAGGFTATRSSPQTSALSQHSQEVLGIHGYGKEGTVTVSRFAAATVSAESAAICRWAKWFDRARRAAPQFLVLLSSTVCVVSEIDVVGDRASVEYLEDGEGRLGAEHLGLAW